MATPFTILNDTWDDGDNAFRVLIVTTGSAGVQRVQGDNGHDSVDSGNPVKIGGKASSAEPAAVANADRVDAYFDTIGRLHVVEDNFNATSTTVTVVSTTAVITVKTANSARKGLTIHNLTTVDMYVRLGASASQTYFSIVMAASSYYEVPFGWTGIVTAVFLSTGAGTAYATEVTA